MTTYGAWNEANHVSQPTAKNPKLAAQYFLDWKPNRLVILEFPTMDQAKRWYDSEEYREPKAMRLRAGRGNMVMVDGVPPA